MAKDRPDEDLGGGVHAQSRSAHLLSSLPFIDISVPLNVAPSGPWGIPEFEHMVAEDEKGDVLKIEATEYGLKSSAFPLGVGTTSCMSPPTLGMVSASADAYIRRAAHAIPSIFTSFHVTKSEKESQRGESTKEDRDVSKKEHLEKLDDLRLEALWEKLMVLSNEKRRKWKWSGEGLRSFHHVNQFVSHAPSTAMASSMASVSSPSNGREKQMPATGPSEGSPEDDEAESPGDDESDTEENGDADGTASQTCPGMPLSFVHRYLNFGAYSVLSEVASYWSEEIYGFLLRRDLRAYYQHLMEVATNYEQWAAAGGMLDKLTGKDKWKNDPVSPDYDYELLQDRLAQLKKARESGNMSSMMFMLRTSLSRNLGDAGNPRLYGATHVGTKRLIEDCIDEVIRQLHFICEEESPQITLKAKYDFFTQTQRAYGRTALCLSGGGALALCHVGVVKTLFEANLLPRVISGSSGGSIIAACVCTRTDEEVTQLLDPKNVNMNFFERPGEESTFLAKMRKFWKDGDDAFYGQEAFNRTRRILNITVSSSTVYEMPRLLNYLTAPNVVIWSAVAASCAVPFVFNSCPLIAKKKSGFVPWNPSGHRWIDGSVEGYVVAFQCAFQLASAGFPDRISHHSGTDTPTVNPHVLPFMHNTPSPSMLTRAINSMAFLVRSEVHHRLTQLSELGVSSPTVYRVRTILSQRYYGDITIVPSIRMADFTRILGNPDPEMMIYCSNLGERATWPQISLLRNRCKIELCVDDMLYRLRIRRFMDARLTIVSESQGPDFDVRLMGPPTAPPLAGNSSMAHSLPNVVEDFGKRKIRETVSSPMINDVESEPEDYFSIKCTDVNPGG
ncbi:hypothetical protein SpCBS45565_g01886 [Spizellomyces sp. 'palustris']|nr:hypothetical protein SpCBS45565_g01886 [Spizellomyces sp. 'palustris']